MSVAVETTPLDWTLISAIAISLALGGLVGLERQSHREPESAFGSVGVRTFALAALLGTTSVLTYDVLPGVAYVVAGGYFALLLAFFWQERRATDHEVGITTQVSAMMVFLIGMLVPDQPFFAASLAVIVAAVLALKRYTNRFVRLLTPSEIVSTMKFLLITVVLLPLLPNEVVDPWGFYNPREIWLLVVLISGISFLAYFSIRFMGTRRGLTLTGILGGMASSTAVTLAMARQVRRHPGSRTMLLSSAFAIMLATAFMFVRVGAAVAVINISLIQTLWVPFVAMSIPGTMIAGAMWWVLRQHHMEMEGEDGEEDEPELELQNPFELRSAFKFAALLIAIIGGANLLQQFYGGGAIYVAAVFGGLAETNAISLAVARLENMGEITASVATQAIVIAILANSVIKAGLAAAVGNRHLGIYVALGLLPIFAAGMGAAFWP